MAARVRHIYSLLDLFDDGPGCCAPKYVNYSGNLPMSGPAKESSIMELVVDGLNEGTMRIRVSPSVIVAVLKSRQQAQMPEGQPSYKCCLISTDPSIVFI
jgi:hypothetical protein